MWFHVRHARRSSTTAPSAVGILEALIVFLRVLIVVPIYIVAIYLSLARHIVGFTVDRSPSGDGTEGELRS